MRSLCRLSLFAFVAAWLICARAQGQPFQVGVVTRDWVDESRRNWEQTGPRPLAATIWYPTLVVPDSGSSSIEPFVVQPTAAGAPIAPSAVKYPLVVISHGTGGAAVNLAWVARELATHGYVVVGVNHHGNTASEPHYDPRGFRWFWERPVDLTRAIDRVQADPELGAAIDGTRIGALGFSLGGYSVLALAGGMFDLAQYETFCRSERRDFTCEPQPEFPQADAELRKLAKIDPRVRKARQRSGASFRDARVLASFAIAPVLGPALTKASLRKVAIPVEIVVGARDTIAPPATEAEVYAHAIPGAKLTVLPGAVAHYTFLPECTKSSKADLPICQDADGVDRVAVHQDVAARALTFFNRTLAQRH